MSIGVRKLAIGALAPDIDNSLLIGVIIAKQNYRIFTSRKDGEERGVWNFTLRDSPVDTINVTFWGSSEGITTIYGNFLVGDVVEIMNARVLFKEPEGADITFSPSVSSPFRLQLQEKSSTLLMYDEEDAYKFRDLMHIPTKPDGDYLRLSDLTSYGQAMKGDYVNILAAVRNLGDIRNVKSSKNLKNILCRDILLMDQTHTDFQITLWEEETIKRADSWRPQQTVIFFADVRVDWNNFRQSVTAVITSKTIITECPNTAEAQALRNYAETFPIRPVAVLDHFAKSIEDPATAINVIMTTAQVSEKAWKAKNLNKFTAVVFALVTSLNLDGTKPPVTYKCSTCSQFVDESVKCLNADCLLRSNAHQIMPTPVYDLKIDLSDHRGTLFNCRLTSPIADEVLGCSVQNYLNMSQTDKTELKWKFLLSRFEVRLLILTRSIERTQPLFSVLTCKKALLSDVASKLPIY